MKVHIDMEDGSPVKEFIDASTVVVPTEVIEIKPGESVEVKEATV